MNSKKFRILWLAPVLAAASLLVGGAHGPALSTLGSTSTVVNPLSAVQASALNANAPALPSLAPLVDSVKAAVVNVDVQTRMRAASLPEEFGSDFFERFFGVPSQPRGRRGQPPVRQGAGSGFIIDSKGLVITNNHVVEGANSIRIRLDDGRAFDAETLGRDPLTDLALVRLKGKVEKLPVVPLGDSDAMRVGDWVVAIGNPFGLASSVSAGIISARERDIRAGPYDDFLQTDAAINPGNSGGPLFNLKGEVIGINTAIIGGGSGIGFAVPSNIAKQLLPQLEKGQIKRGWLGVAIQDLTPDIAKGLGVPVTHGALITGVTDNTPAKKAGLHEDDVVVAVDGKPTESSRALTRSVGFNRPGAKVTLTLYRGAKKQDVAVELGERPDLEGIASSSEGGNEEQGGKSERVGLSVEDAYRRGPRGASGQPERGAVITDVAPGSAADRADLRPGMVIVEAGGKPIRNASELRKAINAARPGSTLLVRIEADGNRAVRALTIP